MSEEDAFRLCMAKIEAGKTCTKTCDLFPGEHYHCRSDHCVLAFKYVPRCCCVNEHIQTKPSWNRKQVTCSS